MAREQRERIGVTEMIPECQVKGWSKAEFPSLGQL